MFISFLALGNKVCIKCLFTFCMYYFGAQYMMCLCLCVCVCVAPFQI